MKTLRLKVRSESYPWLCDAAKEVNMVFNFCNETSIKAATRTDLKRKWLTAYDLGALTYGASALFDKIGSSSIQEVCTHYVRHRRQAKKLRLRWRVSAGTRRSLGWVPFKGTSMRRKGHALRFCGKTFRVFESELLAGLKWGAGCFAQDAVGDWFICFSVAEQSEQTTAPREAVGIDLGLKTIATTSDGEVLEAGQWTRTYADKLAQAQRRGHKRQAKRIHRKLSRCRSDALHKFSAQIVRDYQSIYVGDVSSTKLVKTGMAKSVLDSGWGMLRTFLDYKSQRAARNFSVINERNTTKACSGCGAFTGPTGRTGLSVRAWVCVECGDSHDRDVNSARNILRLGSSCRPPCGNELLPKQVAA